MFGLIRCNKRDLHSILIRKNDKKNEENENSLNITFRCNKLIPNRRKQIERSMHHLVNRRECYEYSRRLNYEINRLTGAPTRQTIYLIKPNDMDLSGET